MYRAVNSMQVSKLSKGKANVSIAKYMLLISTRLHVLVNDRKQRDQNNVHGIALAFLARSQDNASFTYALLVRESRESPSPSFGFLLREYDFIWNGIRREH